MCSENAEKAFVPAWAPLGEALLSGGLCHPGGCCLSPPGEMKGWMEPSCRLSHEPSVGSPCISVPVLGNRTIKPQPLVLP